MKYLKLVMGLHFLILNVMFAALWRSTATLRERDTKQRFTVAGTAFSSGAASDELEAKLNLTVADSIMSVTNSESVSDLIGLAPYVAQLHASTTWTDGNILLRKVDTGSGNTITRVLHIEQITTDVKATDSGGNTIEGKINVNHSLIAALATAYRDGDGNGGYSAYDAEFTA